MNKKGMLQFLLNALIAIALIIALLLFLGKYTRLSAQGKEEFYNLAEEIKELADNPDLNKRLLPGILDEGTAIVGFTKEADAFKVNLVTGKEEVETLAYWPKPDECEKDMPCICICRKGLNIDNDGPARMSCDENGLICESKIFNNFDFKKRIMFKDGKSYWENGFLILRIDKIGAWYITGIKIDRTRRQDIHVMKSEEDGKTIITVCEDAECTLPQEY